MTASGTLGIYPKFRADDADGLPLEGGRLYSYLSGTSTPVSLYHDAELTTPWDNPLVLDSSGEALFYYGPAQYKLALHDAQDVPQWVIDPVPGTGGGGAASAGMGMGSNTVELRPGLVAQASTVVFPASVLALGLTVWVTETFGTSQGLTHIGIGTAEHPDCWGVLPTFTADTETHAGLFLGYRGQPIPADGTVLLTAYGGRFDGTGSVYLTGHFTTFAPSHALGLSWTPPGPPSPSPPDPQPYATETTPGVVELVDATEVLADTDTLHALTIGRLVSRTATETRRGLVELATSSATTTGTDTTRATHPAGVQAALTAALDATVPAGTPRSVARYASSGTTLEASSATLSAAGDLTVTTTGTNLGLTLVSEHTTTTGALIMDAYQPSAGAMSLSARKAHGTLAAPTRLTSTDNVFNLNMQAWLRNAGDTADAWVNMAQLRSAVESVDAQGRGGGSLSLWVGPGVSASPVEALRVTQASNLLLGATTHGTSLTKGLALGNGTAPTTSPADQVQLWAADLNAGAGQSALHLRTETGALYVFGATAGFGTHCTATLGSGAAYRTLNVTNSQMFVRQSTTQERPVALLDAPWVVNTDASRTGRLTLSVYDSVAAREGLRIEASGTAPLLGFYGANAVAKPTVSGSRGGNAALASALSALASLGLVVDSSTA